MKPLTLLFCNVLYGILCVILAKKRNRSSAHWFLLALPLGVLALFLLLLLPALPRPSGDQALTDRSA